MCLLPECAHALHSRASSKLINRKVCGQVGGGGEDGKKNIEKNIMEMRERAKNDFRLHFCGFN